MAPTTWGLPIATETPEIHKSPPARRLSAGCRFFFMYKGALFWRMKAGMGDVVFAPMYLALRNRGVKFRFFHRLDEIQLDKTSQAVTAMKFCRQVPLKQKDPAAPTNYEPLITARGLPCWPRMPLARQFDYDDDDVQGIHGAG